MSGNELHTIEAEFQIHTGEALCVRVDGDEYWFPNSTIRMEPAINYERGDKIEFEAPEWLLVRHGLDNLIDN